MLKSVYNCYVVLLTLLNVANGQDCQREGTIECHEAKYSRYRRPDGACSHPEFFDEEKAKWNSAYNCYTRVMEADFADYWGNEIRKSKTGAPLPNARELSNALADESSVKKSTLLSTVHSQMLMNWGQIIGNEITYPGSKFTYQPSNKYMSKDDDYNCCVHQKYKWPHCAEVRISKSDPFFSKYGVDCINFSRSQPCATCKVDQRAAINMHTPSIDGSTIYGNIQLVSL